MHCKLASFGRWVAIENKMGNSGGKFSLVHLITFALFRHEYTGERNGISSSSSIFLQQVTRWHKITISQQRRKYMYIIYIYLYTRAFDLDLDELERSLPEYKVSRYARIVGAEVLLPQVSEFLASHLRALRRGK
jgi:hypothetical protein